MPEQPALGLERDKTTVQAYDPRWPAAFETELALLLAVLGDTVVRLEHIGSTSVPGLASKPILDLAAGYSDASRIAEAHRLLPAAGYVFHGDQGASGGLLFIKGPESQRTHYLHLVEIDSSQWRNYLFFREALRKRPDLREPYAELKERLAARFPSDRLSYLDGKAQFIEDVLRGGST